MKYNTLKQISIALMASMFCSCEAILDTKSSTDLSEEDHYTIPNEVYASFIGINTAIQKVADKNIIVNELRGDLLEPTENAPEEMWQIHRQLATKQLPLVSPKPYYDIVINCNDFLENLHLYMVNNPGNIPDAVYHGMVSAAINYKVWATFTIAKTYGEADFFHTSFAGESQGGIKRYTINEIPPVLIDYMKSGEKGIGAYQTLDWNLILTNAPEWTPTHMRPETIEGELLLWNKEYQAAIDCFFRLVADASRDNMYKVNGKWKNVLWRNIFVNDFSTLSDEIITGVAYNKTYNQYNILQEYCSNISPNKYYVRPTESIMTDFRSAQHQEFAGDRVRGEGASFDLENNQWVVKKYHINPAIDQFARDANIPLYRASEIHLMIAEAFAHLGEYEAAFALLNEGVGDWYNSTTGFEPPFTGVHETFRVGIGVRNRVGLVAHDLDEIFTEIMDEDQRLETALRYIADEVALELAYEGKRWFTLVRMARNSNNPALLATEVARKYAEGERGAYESYLMNESNWFIKD